MCWISYYSYIVLLFIICGSGLGFVINGIAYSNGSTVLRTDIGENDIALQCTTDRAGCCGGGKVGQFYFPDDTQVPTSGNNLTGTYYRNRFYFVLLFFIDLLVLPVSY